MFQETRLILIKKRDMRNHFLNFLSCCALWFRKDLQDLRKWLNHNVGDLTARKRGLLLCEVQIYAGWVPFYLSLVARLTANKIGARPVAFNLQFSKVPFLLRAAFQALGLPVLWTKPKGANEDRAKKTLGSIRSGRGLLRLRMNKILVGDLIYDTFLREAFRATVLPADLHSEHMRRIVSDTISILDFAEDLLQKQNIRGLIQDHSGYYIYHGVLSRRLARAKIPVFNYADRNSVGLGRVLWSQEQTCSTHNAYWLYPKAFRKLGHRQKRRALCIGKAFIKKRLKGVSDDLILPGVSAYAPNQITSGPLAGLAKTPRPTVLVFMHEFNDAVHCYRSALFADFWEWINYLCREASQTPFHWLLKPHLATNLLGREKMRALSQNCVEELKKRYPKLTFISEQTSNTDLLRLRPSSAFTMYGTVAHEMAWIGIPVVACNDHPHIAYRFSLTARTKKELKNMIHSADKLRKPIAKKKICEYLYMHYFYQAHHGLFVDQLTSSPPTTTLGRSPEGILRQTTHMQRASDLEKISSLKEKIAQSIDLDNPLSGRLAF